MRKTRSATSQDSKQIRAQPDFQALFFEHFGRRPRPHTYKVRFGTSNVYHDVIFLDSLVHDARLSRHSVRRQGGRVTIRLQRETWEVGTLVRKGAPPLHHVPSLLRISGVERLVWRFANRKVRGELSLRGAHLQPPRDAEAYHFILDGYRWKLHLLLNEYRAGIVLHDTGTPRRYPVRTRSNG